MLPARLDRRDCSGSEGRQTVAVNRVNLTVETMHQRVRSKDQLAALFDGGWPPFIDADTVAAQHLPRVRQLFADLEVVLVDREEGAIWSPQRGGCRCAGTVGPKDCRTDIRTV